MNKGNRKLGKIAAEERFLLLEMGIILMKMKQYMAGRMVENKDWQVSAKV